jgi:putative redox protein
MVEISVEYEGGFHCFAIHEPSRAKLPTDAPKDNWGKGEAFSPTDLTATSLGVCMLGVTKLMRRRSVQERRATEGNGPVSETYSASVRCSQVAPGP